MDSHTWWIESDIAELSDRLDRLQSEGPGIAWRDTYHDLYRRCYQLAAATTDKRQLRVLRDLKNEVIQTAMEWMGA